MVIVWKKFETLQGTSETHTLNKYESFVTAHIEVVAECIPTKPRAKCRVPRESLAVKRKQNNFKKASFLNKRNPININAKKLEKAQIEQTNAYQKEQIEHIQSHIEMIRNSVKSKHYK